MTLAKKLKIEKSKSKPKWNILKCADSVLESDMLSGPHIEIFSNTKIILNGCLGVFEYTDSYIKLKLSKGALILCGANFNIAFFENQSITVAGKISSVEFCI